MYRYMANLGEYVTIKHTLDAQGEAALPFASAFSVGVFDNFCQAHGRAPV